MTSERLRLPDPNDLSLQDFAKSLRRDGLVDRAINLARDEDMGVPARDLTGEAMFSPDATRTVHLRARESGVVAGLAFLPDLISIFSPANRIEYRVHAEAEDGSEIGAGTTLATLSGNARDLVALERTMLNLISRMCGIAVLTREYVQAAANTEVAICDTRKTTPGLRVFEKYAVRCGGGATHRMGLHDAILIKDNHIAGLDSDAIATKVDEIAYQIADSGSSLLFVQIEVDTLDQLRAVIGTQTGVVDIVLLDNMSPDELTKAVNLRNKRGVSVLLEASGGVNLDSVHAIAKSGVDRISIGSLTHQAQSLDLGLDAVS